MLTNIIHNADPDELARLPLIASVDADEVRDRVSLRLVSVPEFMPRVDASATIGDRFMPFAERRAIAENLARRLNLTADRLLP